MPEGYLKMKKKFMQDGLSEKAAAAKAARIWNSQHPDNPVTGGSDTRKGRKKK